MADTRVTLCGVELDNPVIPASGSFGYGAEFARFYDLNILGTFSFKGTTLEKRFGNPTPRTAECTGAVLNSVGLQNPGVDAVISNELPRLKKTFRKPLMANVSGFSEYEFVTVCERFEREEQIGFIELNISCPNVKGGGMSFGTTPQGASEITKAVRRVVKKPLIVKLSPNVANIADIARACEGEGADGVSLINTLVGMRINLKTRKPLLANRTGGLSGAAVKPIALRMVYDVYDAVKIPVVGIGGIATAEDVIEMMLAGATAVEVGAQNLIDPFACKKIIETLPQIMDRYGIKKLSEITGGAH